MGDILSTIATHAKALNAQADRASVYIEAVSQKLRDAGVGIEFWGPSIDERTTRTYDDNFEKDFTQTDRLCLGYAKVDNRWGLALQWLAFDAADEFNSEQQATLLENAPREVRIKAMSGLDGFLVELSEALKQEVERLKKVGKK